MLDCSWSTPPTDLSLSPGDVHLWRTSLDQPLSLIQQLRQTLVADELSRAKRFHFERDRQRFIVARGVLREILNYYTKKLPGKLHFSYTDYGKPFLSQPETNLHFNVSHSGDLALYALTRQRAIGIDLEQLRPMPDAEQIAERFFSERENRAFRAIPPAQKEEAFFNCWTRKEAYIKAIGEGLSHPLDTFDVSLAPGEPAALLEIRGAPAEIPRWSLRALTPAEGYIAALVVEGQGWGLSCWQWSPRVCLSTSIHL